MTLTREPVYYDSRAMMLLDKYNFDKNKPAFLFSVIFHQLTQCYMSFLSEELTLRAREKITKISSRD